MLKKLLLKVPAILLMFFLFLPVTNSGAISIGFSPNTSSGDVGSSLDVDLIIFGLGVESAPSIGEFDIDVTFDPTILAFNSITYGNQLDILGLGSYTLTTVGFGYVNLFELSYDLESELNADQADSFTLASLTFDLLGEGTSPLGLNVWSLANSSGEGLTADLLSASVRSTVPVPEPATILLLVTGIFGLGLIKRRNIKKKTFYIR